jgi:glucokinase-like ROK family protein
MVYTPKIGSFEGMKSQNQSTILNVIRLKGPISRAEIAKVTKLTPPTVGGLVSELVEKNLIIEQESSSSKVGGRRPIMLSINYSAYYIIGVYAASEVIRVVLSAMDGKILFDYVQKVTELPTEDTFLDTIKESIQYVLNEQNVERKYILGIGFAMHGLVDPDNGIAIFSPHLKLHNIRIKEILESEFEIPVMVENDVRALAIAESWFGQGQGISEFLCLSVGRGVGSGIFINNEVYKSSFNTAGEIGHTIVDINGPRCSCGSQGCLEACASETAILNRVYEAIAVEEDTMMTQWLKGDKKELSVDLVFKAAREGDPLANQILEGTGRYLGIATANMINILKPSKIILEGRIFEGDDFVLTPLKQMVNQYSLRSSQEGIEIVCSKLGKKGMVLGAVTLVLNKLFMPGGL